MFFANCHIKVYKFISMKKLTLKLPYTAASYSCWKVAPLDITYSKSNIQDFNRYLNREQNQCKPNSRITPFKRMLFISHTENIPLNLQANLVSSKVSILYNFSFSLVFIKLFILIKIVRVANGAKKNVFIALFSMKFQL